MREARGIQLVYSVEAQHERWIVEDDVLVPESYTHEQQCTLLLSVLRDHVARNEIDAMVFRNLAVRWDERHPRMGLDADLAWVEPAPPLVGGELKSVCTWRDGHRPPRVAFECVSDSNAAKDYEEAPEKYAACGARELWAFDPRLMGPTRLGGPHRLQVWRRTEKGRFQRVYAGEGPAFSRELGAWLVPVDEGMLLRIADDAKGRRLWPTEAERERAEKERERSEKERERSEKEREREEKERAIAQSEQARIEMERERVATAQEREAKDAALREVEALKAELAAARGAKRKRPRA